ncbi:hypothetical protein QZH41_020741 [Actinostola sp. cb2023]|nr:hypothetical protein QZH41_020741 [Actinostola sp. cb2023]
MVMEIPENVITSRYVCENQIQDFLKRYECLDSEELVFALMVRQNEVFSLLSHSVPCVGCRRSVERLCNQLIKSGQRALEPLIITTSGILTVSDFFLHDPKLIYALFYIHGSKLSELVDAIPKSRRNRRCPLHSLETHKQRPSGSWMDVWDLLSQECRDEVVLIDSDALLDTLEHYLRKHRFCSECKSKVLRAYSILAGDLDGPSEKGFCSSLYDGLRSCPQERHIHVMCDTDFIAHLIGRAEPEISGGRRERHAKTLDIAQEEVLTCLGTHLWERLHRLWQKLRAEEQTWQMLFYLGVDALRKSFEVAVENKLGISRLEQVVEEISVAERLKELKREQKRLKKKAKRIEKCKYSTSNREVVITNEEEQHKPSVSKQTDEVSQNGSFEDINANGHEGSCDDEDDRDSVDTPCSCEDMQCSRRKWRRQSSWPVCRNGDCSYVGKTNPWSGERDQRNGTSCREEKSSSCGISRKDDEEEFCFDCLSAGSSNSNGVKKKKGKKKKRGTKSNADKNDSGQKRHSHDFEGMDDEEKKLLLSMGWTSGDNCVEECCSSDEDSAISEQDILRFKANHKSVTVQRQELREKLRQKFEKMSLKTPNSVNKPVNGMTTGVTAVH